MKLATLMMTFSIIFKGYPFEVLFGWKKLCNFSRVLFQVDFIDNCFCFSNWGLARERECSCSSNHLPSGTLQDSGIAGEAREGEEEIYTSSQLFALL
jgi:hypothetical protein